MGTTTTNKHWGMVIEDWIVFGLHTQCVSVACELCVHVGLHSMDRWGVISQINARDKMREVLMITNDVMGN